MSSTGIHAFLYSGGTYTTFDDPLGKGSGATILLIFRRAFDMASRS
jgi:hypothetical protein